MNDFREWISDNLRYILLGLFIIIVLLVLFFGIKFAIQSTGDSTENPKVEQEAVKKVPVEKDNVETEKDETLENTDDTQEAFVAEDKALEVITEYYTALGNKDIEKIKACVDTLSVEDEKNIQSAQYIESYSEVSTLVKKGFEENSCVAIVSYKIKLKNINTLYPAANQNYMRKDADGNWHIVASELSQEIQDYMAALIQEEDVKAIIEDVRAQESQVQESDEALKNFLKEIGVSQSSAVEAENGTKIKTKTSCNLRKEASTESDSLMTIGAEEEVTKVGESDDWVEVEYNGTVGFIRGDMLE